MPEPSLPTRSSIARAAYADFVPEWLDPGIEDGRLRLHIGGQEPRAGWKILNIQAGAGVDFVGNCCDLTQFADDTVSVVYASHVLEHLSHRDELPQAFSEIRRVLIPGCVFLISVPDMLVLCDMISDRSLRYNQRHLLMRILFGGQADAHDFHRTGLWHGFLIKLLKEAGFSHKRKVREFGLFDDASKLTFMNRSICLNIIAR